MKAEEIIDKLRPTLRQEGLEVDFLGHDGPVVNIRARRVGPGVPVAFLVKAIAGTYRRYLPEVKDVCLVEYDPGAGIATSPSQTFEPVFAHRPPGQSLGLEGLPVVDLKGLSRRDAIRAIEGFVRLWASRSPLLALRGLAEDAPLRAARKWAAVYRKDYREILEVSQDRWEIVLDASNPERLTRLKSQGDEIMPGKIFLTSEEAGPGSPPTQPYSQPPDQQEPGHEEPSRER
jgi:hypothetical protein